MEMRMVSHFFSVYNLKWTSITRSIRSRMGKQFFSGMKEEVVQMMNSQKLYLPQRSTKENILTSHLFLLYVLLSCQEHMSRYICQAGELVFCDSSSSMDRFNTSVFILSTHSVSSGIPLGVILTSDEREQTVLTGLELLKSVIPNNAFFGRGADNGPDVVMIDDSSAERGALSKCWPSACILLCTFHFLQRQWTWLHEGKNQIQKDDRITIISELKNLVYARSETNLQSLYGQLLKNSIAIKYPHFIQHLKLIWDKRCTWAHCYRKNLLIRGNNTNNYAEAGIKILKEFE